MNNRIEDPLTVNRKPKAYFVSIGSGGLAMTPVQKAGGSQLTHLVRECLLIEHRHFDVKPLDIVTRRVSEGICRNLFPRLRVGLREDAKVALSN